MKIRFGISFSVVFFWFIIFCLILPAGCPKASAIDAQPHIASGTISISSNPSGASVSIDGTNAGTTPVAKYGLPALATHTIVLKLSGYEDYTATVTLADGESRSVSYNLVKKLVVADKVSNLVITETSRVPVQYRVPAGQVIPPVTTTLVVLQHVDPQKPVPTEGTSGTSPKPAGTVMPSATTTTNGSHLATGHFPKTTVPLVSEALGNRPDNLPLSPLIPDRFAPLAAMITGAAVAMFAAFVDSPAGTRFRRPVEKTAAFARNLIPGEIAALVSVTEARKRGLVPSAGSEKPRYILSRNEWIVVGIASVGFAVAFLIQNRLSIEMQKFLIFLCMGACVVILHDVGHRIMANRLGRDAEIQFWGLGFMTMLGTAWIFGNAFAKPSRAIIGGGATADAKSGAIIQAAGPVINLAAAGLSLLLIPLGGFFAVAGSAGFSMNLLSCVYSLLPVLPMEGKTIWDWSRVAWIVFCLPLILAYAFVYLFL